MNHRSRKVTIAAFTALAVTLILEGVSHAGLWLRESINGGRYDPLETRALSERHRDLIVSLVAGEPRYLVHSKALGWTIRPGASADRYRSNSQGLRAERDYAARPEGKIRLASFGDSFTHGDSVSGRETWQFALEDALDSVEVLNFGVPGYGLDQALLRYRTRWHEFYPQIVLIGYMTDDIFRHVNVYRPFYLPPTELPLTKPRFVSEDDGLLLLPNPLPDLSDYDRLLKNPASTLSVIGQNDYFFGHRAKASQLDFFATLRALKVVYYRLTESSPVLLRDGSYNPESEAFLLTTHLLNEFVKVVREQPAEPIILIFPQADDLRRSRRGESRRYERLVSFLRERNLPYIDLLDAFPTDVEVQQIVRAHYSPRGNQMVGKFIAAALREKGMGQQGPAVKNPSADNDGLETSER